ncbi:MAG: cell division topological specificity factor MinE [Candidatus Eremiobacterota bacterium]
MDFLMKFDFLQRLFGRDRGDNSRDAARTRLQVALVGDRSTVAPRLMESVRRDLIEVLNRYMEIDVSLMTMDLKKDNQSVSLAAVVPVRRIKRQGSLPEACTEESAEAPPADASTERRPHPRKLRRDKKLRKQRSGE